MKPEEQARELYQTAYSRWCYEMSHEKNVLTARDIATYICDQKIDAIKEVADDELVGPFVIYWLEVKREVKKISYEYSKR